MSKLRPKGVSDGKTVNIPLPPLELIQGTQEDKSAAYWIAVSKERSQEQSREK